MLEDLTIVRENIGYRSGSIWGLLRHPNSLPSLRKINFLDKFTRNVEIEQLVLAAPNLEYLISSSKLKEEHFVILLSMSKSLKKIQICPDRGPGFHPDEEDEDDDRNIIHDTYRSLGYDTDPNNRYIDRFIDQMPLLEAWHFGARQRYKFTGQHPAMQ